MPGALWLARSHPVIAACRGLFAARADRGRRVVWPLGRELRVRHERRAAGT